MPCSDCNLTFTALKKLKECQLFSRVRRNQAPDASERIELTELISQGERDLVGYEETIARLHEMIVALKNEQRALNRQIRLAKSLLAPIRKLPPEVLRQIFIAHGSTNTIRSDKSAICHIPGLKKASICLHWRSVAMETTTLWNDISVKIRNDAEYDSRLPLTEQLLALSRKSLLSISIDIQSPTEAVISTIPMFDLLCAHANRWKCLMASYNTDLPEGFQAIVDVLASIHGRLDNLHTFDVIGSFQQCSAWIEGAPKVQTLSLLGIDSRSTLIPWNQIVNLHVKESCVLRIAQSLEKMPNLSSLNVNYFRCRKAGNVTKVVSHSNLKSLDIWVTDDEDETGMMKLFELLTLPQLQNICIGAENDYLTNQNGLAWSSTRLPSLILRSSALITSFSLEEVWMPASHLISLLRGMPALSSLLLSESTCKDSDIDPMINDQLPSSMHMQHHDQQPILTRLMSLTLEVNPHASFSVPTYIGLIHSRWKPVCLDDDEVACIKTARLVVRASSIAPNTVDSLMVLRKRGLDITIEDINGAVISENGLVEWSHI